MTSTTTPAMPTQELVAANRTRTAAAGVDSHQYEQVTGRLRRAEDWTTAFQAAAREHHRDGRDAEQAGHRRSAGEAYLRAALWAHFATTWPNPDREAHAEATRAAAAAYRAALAQLDARARWIERRDGSFPFTGVLRRPTGVINPPLALIICGLDSGKEEFHHVAEALLARGVATFAFDGPGQAELSATTTIEPRYERVVARVLDVLADDADAGVDLTRAGAIALSLGGHYGVRAAAAEPRLRALVTVSGVATLRWEALAAPITDTLAQRCGDERLAREFAATVDAEKAARELRCPLLVVAGGQDPTPRPEEAKRVADAAPDGRLHLVEDGDHLLANRGWRWLGVASDWLADRLTS